MGWTGDSATLKPAGESRASLSFIPTVKDDMRGLGANSGQASASSLFSAFGSKGLKFVTAGASQEMIKHRLTEGQDYSSLLQRLNAAKQEKAAPIEAAEASLSDAAEEKPKQKSKKRKADEVAEVASIKGMPEIPILAPIIVEKPKPTVVRNAARAKYLKSKRLAASNPADMAGILGYIVTPSPVSTATPTPADSRVQSPAPVELLVTEPALSVAIPLPQTENQEQPERKKKKKKSKHQTDG